MGEALRQAIPMRIAKEVPGLDLPVTASMGVIVMAEATRHKMAFAEFYARADALIDIGAGMTSIAVHKFGIAVGVATVPMGSADITDDIAAAFDTKRSIAERLKTFDGAAVATIRDQSDPVLIPPSVEDGSVEARKVPRAQLVAVIRTRPRSVRDTSTRAKPMSCNWRDRVSTFDRIRFTPSH